MTPKRYTVGELAELGSVSRRTVRFYVQEGLIPPPSSRGRGASYGPEHLEALLQVKSLQESGLTLEDIRNERDAPALELGPKEAARELWTRVVLRPGVELHVESGKVLPSPVRLTELIEWCRLNVRDKENEDA